MYLGNDDSHTYIDAGGTQRHKQAAFLLLFYPEDDKLSPETLRACVRQVALEQWGHHMLGKARVGGETLTVDGTYGNKGLPMRVPQDLWEHYGTPVPDRLYEAWKEGGGHNSGGAEMPALREWALENLDALTPA